MKIKEFGIKEVLSILLLAIKIVIVLIFLAGGSHALVLYQNF